MIDQLCFNEALLEGTKEVFETMIFIDLQECDPATGIDGDSILSAITFKGDMEGCLAISCSVPCAKTIALNMLAMEPDDPITEEEISDAMGEVANMVMGSVKSRIQDQIGTLDVSIPSVVSGRMLENSLGDNTVKVSAKFSIEEKYVIEFSLLYKSSRE